MTYRPDHNPVCTCVDCEAWRVNPARIIGAPLPLANVEWWVMKILVAGGALVGKPDGDAWKKLPKADREAMLKGITEGTVVVIGDDVCEPVEVYKDEDRAVRRALEEHKRTGVAHKVTLNADIPA